MEDAKFTPGPWVVDDVFWQGAIPANCEEWRTENKSVKDIRGKSICMVQGDSEKPMEANAALIAAAPDMYLALGEIIEVIGDKTEYKNGCDCIDCVSIRKAVAALSKARGESPTE